jgi:hypothetical protein
MRMALSRWMGGRGLAVALAAVAVGLVAPSARADGHAHDHQQGEAHGVASSGAMPIAMIAERESVEASRRAWTILDEMPEQQRAAKPWVRPAPGSGYASLALDFVAMREVLRGAPGESWPQADAMVIALPDPDGNWQEFAVWESSVMEAGLAAKLPDVRTFTGQGLTDRAATIRLDYTALGFHAQVLGLGRTWAIDPYTKGDAAYYTSYDVRTLPAGAAWGCHVKGEAPMPQDDAFASRNTGATLRSYRLAVAATASFTSFYGGPSQALAGLVTIVNRINQVWERDLAVRFVLVANNDLLIYSDAGTQPYSDGTLSAMIEQNQANIDMTIGQASYDVGHVVSGLGLGGLAQLNAACVGGKARGGTGLSNPSGDFFAVQYMSHELGHQFGAGHAFNAGDGRTCSDNRMGSSAFEPGSGSTIMGYVGLCGSASNLQSQADAMFNAGAYAQMITHINGQGSCFAGTPTGNTVPTAVAGNPIAHVPKNTALLAALTSTDPDGDTLTYSWEQQDLGPEQPASGAGSEDNGSAPLFRVFAPGAASTRSFPRLEDVVDGTLILGERYPTRFRYFKTRGTVRDNRAGAGGVRRADQLYYVYDTAGPFVITSQATGATIDPGPLAITWDPAGTNVSPFNAFNVRVTLSTDGGATYPYTLAASTPNDGSETVTIPTVATTTARIRIDAIGNIFYDVNGANQTIRCTRPDSVLASIAFCDRVEVSWSGVPGATQYRVRRSTNPASTNPTTLTTINAPATSFNDTTGVSGTTYYYWIQTLSSGCTAALVNPVQGRRGTGPQVVTPPSPTTVDEGQQATLAVSALGSGLTYQWRRNGVPLPSQARFSGITSPTLVINPASESDAGQYDVVVGSSCGSATSATAALVVNPVGCDGIDFNGDGIFPDNGDIVDFVSVFAGEACPTGTCGDIDFNNDGVFPDNEDVTAFLSAMAGAEC